MLAAVLAPTPRRYPPPGVAVVVDRNQFDRLADHESIRRHFDAVLEGLVNRPKLLILPMRVDEDLVEKRPGPHRPFKLTRHSVTLFQPGPLEGLDGGQDRCLGLFQEFAQVIQGLAPERGRPSVYRLVRIPWLGQAMLDGQRLPQEG